MIQVQRWFHGNGWLFVSGLLLLLGACRSPAPVGITPAGASAGLNTFVYLYTEN